MGHVARMEDENYTHNFSRKNEYNTPYERPGLRWEDNIRMNHK